MNKRSNLNRVLLGAGLVAAASAGAYGLMAQTSSSESVTFPGGESTPRIEVTATVVDESGLPWSGDVTIEAEQAWASGVALSSSEVTPDASGNVAVDLYVKHLDPAQPVQLRFWAHAESIAYDVAFLVAEDGRAAFRSGTPTPHPQGGYSIDLQTVSLALPPAVATINFSPNTGEPLRLFAQDVDLGDFDSFAPLTGSLPIGTSSVTLYCWGRASAWNFALLNDNSTPLVESVVRRGGSATVTAASEASVLGQVDLSVHPGAQSITVVPPTAHMDDPDPLLMATQRGQNTFSYPNSSLDASGGYGPVVLAPGSYVVELWDASSALLEAKSVVLPSGSTTVDFP